MCYGFVKRIPHHHSVLSSTWVMLPRLQNFPRGLGKGSDAAVMGAWLERVFSQLTEDDVPASWIHV